MRLLADSNIARATVLAARKAGHDVLWAGEREVDPGDELLLAEAVDDFRVFLTKDHDLGALVFRDHADHAGVLLIDELHGPDAEAALVLKLLATHEADLAAGKFLRADGGGVREGRA